MKDERRGHIDQASPPGRRYVVEDEEKFLGTS